MTQLTDTILDRIVAHKREELAASKAATSLAEMRSRAAAGPAIRDFAAALRRPGPSTVLRTGVGVIAEVKKASPSRGVLRADVDHVGLAKQYAQAGACAI